MFISENIAWFWAGQSAHGPNELEKSAQARPSWVGLKSGYVGVWAGFWANGPYYNPQYYPNNSDVEN